MDVSRLRQGEKIAAGSAIALILIMFIFDWFGVSLRRSATAVLGVEGSRNAWGRSASSTSFCSSRLWPRLAMAYFSASGQSVSLPIALSAIVAGLGILCVILVLFRIIDARATQSAHRRCFEQGVDVTRKIGVFLGLIAAAGVAYGGYLAMQEEGTSFSDTRDQLQDRMGGPGSGSGGGTPPPRVAERLRRARAERRRRARAERRPVRVAPRPAPSDHSGGASRPREERFDGNGRLLRAAVPRFGARPAGRPAAGRRARPWR